MFEITINNHTQTFDKPVQLLAIKPEGAYIAKVNNRVRELTYYVDKDANVEFLGLNSADAIRAYEATLRYVFLMALNNIMPQTKVRVSYGVSMSLFIELKEATGVDEKMVEALNIEMQDIINHDYPIQRKDLNIKDAIKYFEEKGFNDKKEIMKYRKEEKSHLYYCNEYKNYMFGYMLPSTGYIKDYRLLLYFPGIVLQYPRCECGGAIPPFNSEPKYAQTLLSAKKWSRIVNCDNISDLNRTILDGNIVDFINICESKHSRMLAQIGDNIFNNKDNIRLISIAGPSSSGKTTFCNRVRIELLSRGIKPLMISMDDYYKNRASTPLDEGGKPDFEHIEALDIDLFNKDMLTLVLGGSVTLPVFNFKTGLREVGKTVSLEENSILLIEGIHALNERLTSLIPRNQKYKIYIAPQQQINIDDHNPIRLTDIRLLRRLVRDLKYRNTPVEKTLEMWNNVRKGEFRWIYQFQEDADYIFNSELTYELGVMKKYALPILETIEKDSQYFITANRIIKFLKYFIDIEDDYVPCNSLLREFIGGSCFRI